MTENEKLIGELRRLLDDINLRAAPHPDDTHEDRKRDMFHIEARVRMATNVIDRLLGALERDGRDVRRYRWLRDSEDYEALSVIFRETKGEHWNTAIDAAIRAEGGES